MIFTLRFSHLRFPGFLPFRAGTALLVAAILLAGRSSEAASPVVVTEGFEAEDFLELDPRAALGGIRCLADGGTLLFLGGELQLMRQDTVVILSTFSPDTFGSFVVPEPGGDAVIFGESTEGKIYRIPLTGGGERTHIDTIGFSYGLVFDGAGNGLVSAPGGPGNRILLLDRNPATENPVLIDNIGGFSGPLVLDDRGNLFYGTADFARESQALVRFSREQIEGALAGTPLDFSEGEVILTELGSINQMVWVDDRIYYTDLGFAAGVGQVLAVDTRNNFAVSELARIPSDPGVVSPSFISFCPGAAEFAPGAGPEGGSLLVAYSDFSTLGGIVRITPELHFIRGHINGDGSLDITDAVFLLEFLFLGGSPPSPLEAGDVNDDDQLDLSDALYLLNYLFLGGPPPEPPFPDSGPDPTDSP